MSDPGFVADVMVSKGNDEAKAILRRLGIVEMSEVCEHDWHHVGTMNGKTEYVCQKCGLARHVSTETTT